MNLSKDTYEYIFNFTDDRTILNMLSVNKKFRDEKFFENIVRRKYSSLVDYKKEDTWKKFYINIIYYLSKLEEDFQFPYIENAKFDAKLLYEEFSIQKNDFPIHSQLLFIIGTGLEMAIKANNIEKLEYFLNRGRKETSLSHIMLENALSIAAENGHLDVVKYLLKQKAGKINWATTAAARGGHLDIVKYLFLLHPENIINQDALLDAIDAGHLHVVKYLLSQGVVSDFDQEDWEEIEKNQQMYKLLKNYI